MFKKFLKIVIYIIGKSILLKILILKKKKKKYLNKKINLKNLIKIVLK